MRKGTSHVDLYSTYEPYPQPVQRIGAGVCNSAVNDEKIAAYRATVKALSVKSNRELDDVGLSRDEISKAAWIAAGQ